MRSRAPFSTILLIASSRSARSLFGRTSATHCTAFAPASKRAAARCVADEPGLGKTFVALALAHEYAGALVVAPAALRAMWRDAAAAARIEISFVSLEALVVAPMHPPTRTCVSWSSTKHITCAIPRRHDMHVSHASLRTAMYCCSPRRRCAIAAPSSPRCWRCSSGRAPIRSGDAQRAHCIIRRAGDATLLPAIDGPHWRRAPVFARLDRRVAQLPPALPALDGRAATALITMTLVRSWASSLAALDAALRRRLLRGAALGAILDEGRIPTRHELRAWVMADDSVQLAFPMFVTHELPDTKQFRAVLDAHLQAIRATRERIGPAIQRDSEARARFLLDLRAEHPGARIVAFTSYTATAESIYRSLRRAPGVALLTARGARTAGGARPRGDVITALGATSRRPARDEISLVLTTDLLSEGVNLQGASVIVHLDMPWTPAGLDQRVGRAARMGSAHARVHVHGIAPPAAAERLLTLDRRFHRKRIAHIDATAAPYAAEELRVLVQPWRADAQLVAHHECIIACVRASRDGLIAVVGSGTHAKLVCGSYRAARWNLSDTPDRLLAMARSALRGATVSNAKFESGAHAAVRRWLAHGSARRLAGSLGSPSRARRMLLANIDAHAQRSAAHTRAIFAPRIEKVRALIDQAISAGAEHTLDALARRTDSELNSLLSACEAQLPAACTQSARATRPWTIRALLLLLRVP